MRKTPSSFAQHIRQALRDGGSAEHAVGVQRFFQEEIQSYGWYTRELRQLAARTRREILGETSPAFLVDVADKLFRGRVLEEKVFAVFLLEKLAGQFGEREFPLLESWLDRVSSWADHDALVHGLLAPMLLADSQRRARIYVWAGSACRWHRRAAAVVLIRGVRQRLFFADVVRLTEQLLQDQDDMVRKGLGWLLRETAKADASRTVPLLLRLRGRVPRMVLRTACETLPARERARVLDLPVKTNPVRTRRQRPPAAIRPPGRPKTRPAPPLGTDGRARPE